MLLGQKKYTKSAGPFRGPLTLAHFWWNKSAFNAGVLTAEMLNYDVFEISQLCFSSHGLTIVCCRCCWDKKRIHDFLVEKRGPLTVRVRLCPHSLYVCYDAGISICPFRHVSYNYTMYVKCEHSLNLLLTSPSCLEARTASCSWTPDEGGSVDWRRRMDFELLRSTACRPLLCSAWSRSSSACCCCILVACSCNYIVIYLLAVAKNKLVTAVENQDTPGWPGHWWEVNTDFNRRLVTMAKKSVKWHTTSPSCLGLLFV